MDNLTNRITIRKTWIDVLRGLAILFVIYGHLLKPARYSYLYFLFTSPIKIPLFFAISGYLFKEKISFSEFIKKIIKGLIIPWLVLSITPILLSGIFNGMQVVLNDLKAVLTGTSVWYMPCCIIAELMFFLYIKNTKNPLILTILSCVLSVVGIILINHRILDFMMINRALSVQIYLLLGYMIKRYENRLDRIKTRFVLCGIALYFIIGYISAILYPEASLDVHMGSFYNIIICFAMIIIGCTSLFCIAKRIPFKNYILVFLGQNTLIYYIWGNYPISLFNFLSSRIGISIHNVYLDAFVRTVFICCVCAVASILINCLIPEIVGKKRRKVMC